MKINSPEDIVSAYATMRLLEPICDGEDDGSGIQLRIRGDRLSICVTDVFDLVVCRSRVGSLEMIPVFERYRSLADKLNAAMAPEQSENQ